MMPYFPDPSWFEAYWCGKVEPKPNMLPAWIALACSAAVFAFAVLGGFGRLGA